MFGPLDATSPGSLDGPPSAAVLSFVQERLAAVFITVPGWLVDGSNRFFWIYLASFALLGAVAYRRSYRGSETASRGLLRFLFPPELYRHPSARLDYKLVLTNRFFGPSTLLARLLLGPLSVTYVATLTQNTLVDVTGGSHAPAAWSTGALLAFVLCTALVDDFATYVVHGLHHRSPLLWEFHKVHHSAEVLTPITVYRKHPVYNLLSRVTNIVILGPFEGLIAFLFIGPAEPSTLFGANVVFSLFHLLGANLRHSHIWLSFGPVLSHVFISPAQHQIHHSKAPQHWDKNYGEVFALWDWLFGTLHVPGREREEIEFGLPGDEGREHSTLAQLYFVPFTNCAKRIRASFTRRLPSPATR
jgi:sterol desaturase/sphingolipid hydroxylase (fatty acid hydroxylase superfamily)